MALAMENGQKTGSVGASWPPGYDSHNQRVKGFCAYPVSSKRALDRMVAQVERAQACAPQATRTTVRAFVRRELIEGLAQDAPDFHLEAKLDAGNALPGHDLVYLSRNSPRRMPDERTLHSEIQSVRSLGSVPRVSREEARQRIERAGYRIGRLVGATSDDLGALLSLYRQAYQEYTFQISPRTIQDMLGNGNLVYVARGREGGIASCLIAEHARVHLEGGPDVHLYELSDYATFRSERGNGLITLMQIEAIASLRALPHGPGSVVYAGDRAPWSAVNRSSRKAGMDYCGTLLQHCVLVSDRDIGRSGRYEDLNVWVHMP